MKTTSTIPTVILILLFRIAWSQDSIPGWAGHEIIPSADFYNTGKWTPNAVAGNSCSLTSTDSSLNMHWKIISGTDRWVQCYYSFGTPVSLDTISVFGIDIKGSSCDNDICHHNFTFKIKFENYAKHAWFVRTGEGGMLGINRWVENLFILKEGQDFEIADGFDWNNITVISLEVIPDPYNDTFEQDSGIVSFRNFKGANTNSWNSQNNFDSLSTDSVTMQEIKDKAAQFIAGRQASTGLLCNWIEDSTSNLYGQGLALKILTREGSWNNSTPTNNYAEAAKKLAHFLISEQDPEGFWPRSWNCNSGDVLHPYEYHDSSVWFGDFPWIIMGLNNYYRKSGDDSARLSVEKASVFLDSLIEGNGKLYTVNAVTGEEIEVSSTEAYAATIGALYELEDTVKAEKLIQYIHSNTWDSYYKYWKEQLYGDRVVLFANTWLALLLHDKGYKQEALNALTFVGKLLYTRGPGTPYGFDGIGPVATWFEGTLSYTMAGGAGSSELFNNMLLYKNSDGSVPHYNDNISNFNLIWAADWPSLDGTSWLYYNSAGFSPFHVFSTDTITENVNICEGEEYYGHSMSDTFYIKPVSIGNNFTVRKVQLYVNSAKLTTITDSICAGDSVLIAGKYEKTTGNYYDTLISSTNCDSIVKTILTVYNCTLPNTVTLESKVEIYPIPVKDIVNIDVQGRHVIKLYNNKGALLKETLSAKIDFSSYPEGIYFLHVIDSDNNILIKKIIHTR